MTIDPAHGRSNYFDMRVPSKHYPKPGATEKPNLLTDEQIEDIDGKLKRGLGLEEIADEYGTNRKGILYQLLKCGKKIETVQRLADAAPFSSDASVEASPKQKYIFAMFCVPVAQWISEHKGGDGVCFQIADVTHFLNQHSDKGYEVKERQVMKFGRDLLVSILMEYAGGESVVNAPAENKSPGGQGNESGDRRQPGR